MRRAFVWMHVIQKTYSRRNFRGAGSYLEQRLSLKEAGLS